MAPVCWTAADGPSWILCGLYLIFFSLDLCLRACAAAALYSLAEGRLWAEETLSSVRWAAALSTELRNETPTGRKFQRGRQARRRTRGPKREGEAEKDGYDDDERGQ